jgi:hypothetical protein
MQGVYVNMHRPKTKKALKAAIADDPVTVTLEAPSMFGDEYSGAVTSAPPGMYYVVGPDPYTSRKWYATIAVGASGRAIVS